MKKFSLLFLGLFLTAGMMHAQIRKVTAEVTNAFASAYPAAINVTWKDNLTNFEAQFDLSGDHAVAKFNSKGEWIETTRDMRFENLSFAVKDGFAKSKYKDWNQKEIKELTAKKKETLYRLYVNKEDGHLLKKYLYFNTQGQLVKDALTL